jgi:glycosyltransferase involved in cell wall biosynthesis
MHREPLVSIIIPVYNNQNHLAACINSALAQTWQNKEIILVDDGSTDNSFQIARQFETDSVKVISQANAGASAARNAGFRASNGEYIQFLDADDLLSAAKIEAQLNCLNGSQNHLAICRTVHFNDGSEPEKGIMADEWFYKDHNDVVEFLIRLYAGEDTLPGYGGMVALHSWLTPRGLIEKAGPWNENLTVDDDGEFFCRVVLASEAINYSNKGIAYYRKYNDRSSLSAQKTRKASESMVQAIDLKMEHLKKRSIDPLIDRVFAKHYWWAGVLAYPRFKSISAYCIKKGRALQYSGEKYVGGPAGHRLTAIMGWKFARWLVYNIQRLRRR